MIGLMHYKLELPFDEEYYTEIIDYYRRRCSDAGD